VSVNLAFKPYHLLAFPWKIRFVGGLDGYRHFAMAFGAIPLHGEIITMFIGSHEACAVKWYIQGCIIYYFVVCSGTTSDKLG